MTELIDRIFYLPLGYVNAYLLEQNGELTLVDAGLKGHEKRIARHLGAAGYSLDDIDRVIVTHAHPDHVGALPEVLMASGAEVWVHHRDAPVLCGEQPLASIRPAPDRLPGLDRLMASLGPAEQPIVPLARELNTFDLLDEVRLGLRVLLLPGHTPGQIGLWLEREGLLIGGDVMMRLPWGLTPPPRGFSFDWEETKRSVGRVADLAPDILCLGHGPPIVGGAARPASRLAERLGV